jgi:hypothetical protein
MRIPKRSTDRYVFVSNIKDPLAGTMNPFPKKMGAFLLSETYSTNQTLTLTANARKVGCLIVSDNGNFSRMKAIAAEFIIKGQTILDKARKDILEKKKVSKATLLQREKLVTKIIDHVAREQQGIDVANIIERQLKCAPDYIIGMEDLTVPVLHLCSMLHPLFDPGPKVVKPFQQNTQRIFQAQKIGAFGSQNDLKKVLKFLVFHAFDYASARQASKLNKKIRPEGIAISFGAALASRSYIQSLKIGIKTYKFDETLPESYLLSISIILGAISNQSQTVPVHILGIGTPILLILLAVLLRKSKAVSIDSTATFKDADDGNIYGSRDAYMKLDMYKVAAYSLINNDPYHSSSPWFNWFDAQYPSDWSALKSKLNVKTGDDINSLAKRLKSKPKWIEKYIPFFSPMRSGNDIFIRKVRLARAGGNFWVLKTICDKVRRIRNSKVALHKWVEQEVERYEKSADRKWAATVRKCFEIMKDQLE